MMPSRHGIRIKCGTSNLQFKDTTIKKNETDAGGTDQTTMTHTTNAAKTPYDLRVFLS